ncbi:MAG: imidazoleglycerol-phosphate dehydratase HisB [Spirochaetota bacterium]
MSRRSEIERNTKETQIRISLDLDQPAEPSVSTGVPFFDHMLTAMAFHGRFGLEVVAHGDLEVDPHHVVEDTGIVLGSCLDRVLREGGTINRFGHAVIPMDEALAEATIDVCGRPTLAYRADYPHQYAGSFALWLVREFFSGLSMSARLALHLECRYGENAHHMVEALFKALGRALGQAYGRSNTPANAGMSTKGMI